VQRWADLGLDDPVKVLAEEQRTREHLPDFRSPKRAALQAHFDATGEQPPRGW
jgi:hypothetical protein